MASSCDGDEIDRTQVASKEKDKKMDGRKRKRNSKITEESSALDVTKDGECLSTFSRILSDILRLASGLAGSRGRCI